MNQSSPENYFNKIFEDTEVLYGEDGAPIVRPKQIMDESLKDDPFGIQNTPFDANLAEFIPEHKLSEIARDLVMAIEEDIDSRKPWESKMSFGFKQLGFNFNQTASDNLPLVSSSAFLNTQISTCVQIFGELFPSENPCRVRINGDNTQLLTQKSKNIEEWMNYFFTCVALEFVPLHEQVMFWSILFGSCFSKTFFDPALGRPTSVCIRPDYLIINNGMSSLSEASRITHRQILSIRDFKMRVKAGMYKDSDIEPQSLDEIDSSELDHLINETQGTQDTNSSHDKFYTIDECHTYLNLFEKFNNDAYSSFDIPLPYLVSIDVHTKKIVGLYRNWENGDPLFKRREFFTDYIFIRGPGPYGLGLVHTCSNDSEAATLIEREIIQSTAYANFPGGIKSRKLKMMESDLRPNPGEFLTAETGDQPISNLIMPWPYKDPSPMSFELLKKLEDNINSVGSILNQKISDFNPNAAVGTTYLFMENMHKVLSYVMKNFYRSLSKEFGLFYNLFGKVLPEGPYPFLISGQNMAVMKEDFLPNFEIVPSADPNVLHSAQRLLRWEAILNYAAQAPEMFNRHYIYEMILREMKVPDLDKVLVSEEQLQQQAQQAAQNQPPDPAQLLYQSEKEKTDATLQRAQMDMQIKQQELMQKQQELEARIAEKQKDFDYKEEKLAQESEIAHLRAQIELYKAFLDSHFKDKNLMREELKNISLLSE